MMNRENLRLTCEKTIEFSAKQLYNLLENHPDYFPMYTQNGKWKHGGEAWTNWCEGFLGGQLWLIFQATGDDYFREKAEHYSRLVEHRKTDRNVHDLGFLFLSTWKRWYDLSGDEDKNAVVIEAGQTLAKRFQEKGEYLCSFVAAESLFIDIMMNVPIIFYAAQETDDEELWEIAYRHCLTTRRYLVRGDGSTSHEGIFDLENGQFLRQSTHQGWRDDSSWARGMAWSLYGFGTVYGFTGDACFLQTSQNNAWYYMENTADTSGGVPPNDWMEPEPQNLHESSAAAITASGLLQLSQLTGTPTLAKQYNDYALQIVDTLMQPEFLAIEDDGWEGILKQGMYHERLGLGVNESVMWGDYFFLEAVCKVLGVE